MSDFTYELPSEDGFFNAVMIVLGNDPKYSNKNYYNVLRDGYCEISATSSFSQRRWDAMYTIKKYFPSQGWISTKIDELYKVRCLIAHNCYAGDDEKDMVALYYKQIVKQIGSHK